MAWLVAMSRTNVRPLKTNHLKTSFADRREPKPIKLPKVTGWVVNHRPTFQLQDFPLEYTPFDQKGLSHRQFQRPEISAKADAGLAKPLSSWNNHQVAVLKCLYRLLREYLKTGIKEYLGKSEGFGPTSKSVYESESKFQFQQRKAGRALNYNTITVHCALCCIIRRLNKCQHEARCKIQIDYQGIQKPESVNIRRNGLNNNLLL